MADFELTVKPGRTGNSHWSESVRLIGIHSTTLIIAASYLANALHPASTQKKTHKKLAEYDSLPFSAPSYSQRPSKV
jgi:hypothetical protein